MRILHQAAPHTAAGAAAAGGAAAVARTLLQATPSPRSGFYNSAGAGWDMSRVAMYFGVLVFVTVWASCRQALRLS